MSQIASPPGLETTTGSSAVVTPAAPGTPMATATATPVSPAVALPMKKMPSGPSSKSPVFPQSPGVPPGVGGFPITSPATTGGTPAPRTPGGQPPKRPLDPIVAGAGSQSQRAQPSPLTVDTMARSFSSPITPSSTPTTLQSPASAAGAAGKPSFADRLEPRLVEVLLARRPEDEPRECDDSVREVARAIAEAIAKIGSGASDRFKVLYAGLKDPLNYALREGLINGSMPLSQFLLMKENDLVNPELRVQNEKEMEERMKARNVQLLLAATAGTGTSLYKCPACGKRNCSMNQKQTRSGDEPMTVFLTCLECYRVFRR